MHKCHGNTYLLKPVVIGKFAKPGCFKNVNMNALPVICYKSYCNAWMNSEIFTEWFKKDFAPAVKHHQHAQNNCSPKSFVTDWQLHCPSQRTKEQWWLHHLHVPSSKHNFIDSAYGSRCLAGGQEWLQKETSSKMYHKSRHWNKVKSEGNREEVTTCNCERFNLHACWCVGRG